MKFAKWFVSAFFLSTAWVFAAHAAPVLNQDYKLINPAQPVESGKQIEVLEFFWYGCPHCYELQPALKGWMKRMPKDVQFRYVPAIFRDSWTNGAKLYYALESLGEVGRLHEKVYEAIHAENLDFNDDRVIAEWAVKQGIARQKFDPAYGAFSMQSKVNRSKQMSRDYQLQGTPAVVVDGKYLTAPSMAGSYEKFTQVLDQLIEMARQERSGKKK